jgi:hypothetical protein
MAYRVFVSHAWSDLWVAQQLERRIRQDSAAETFIGGYVAMNAVETYLSQAPPGPTGFFRN